jgi:hypothetical protein
MDLHKHDAVGWDLDVPGVEGDGLVGGFDDLRDLKDVVA